MKSDPIIVLYGWQFLLNFDVFCLTCNNIMHILPLPLCGLYIVSVRGMVMGNIVHVKTPC